MTKKIELSLITFVEDMKQNIDSRLEGVIGVTCIHWGSIPIDYIDRYCGMLGPDEHFSSVEIYENGAFNLFIKYFKSKDAHKFLRVREVEVKDATQGS